MPIFASRARHISAASVAIALGFAAALAAAPAANAASFTVTSLLDDGSGGTLREAIVAANASVAADTITITAVGAINLTSTITISRALTLNGPGAANLTLTRTGDFELFEVDMATDDQDLSFSGITFDGGGSVSTERGIDMLNLSSPPRNISITNAEFNEFETNVVGGAVRILNSTGDLVLDGLDVHDNISTGGVPALSVNGIDGDSTVSNSDFANNDGESGGGLNLSGGGAVTLSNLTFTSNSTWNAGGGLAVYDVASVSLTNSSFTSNSSTSQVGGAAYIGSVSGPVTIQNTSFLESSSASTKGGALYVDGAGALDVVDSTFFNSAAAGNGGSAYLSDSGATTISGSSFSQSHSGDLGGAIDFENLSGVVEIMDNTFAGNTADTGGGAVHISTADQDVLFDSNSFVGNSADTRGGAIFVEAIQNSSFTVVNDTFANNLEPSSGGGTSLDIGTVSGSTVFVGDSTFYEPNPLTTMVLGLKLVQSGTVALESSTVIGANGALYVQENDTTSLRISHSIIDGDVGNVGGIFAFDIGFNKADVAYSILTGPFDAASLIAGSGNQYSTDPELDALVSNGGPTQTMMPLTGSPAIDAGDPSLPDGGTDQRGKPRLVGIIDIGAVEVDSDYFDDVASNATFYVPIQWMGATGASTGTPQPIGLPLYKPTSPVSRQAMAAFLYRLSGDTTFGPPSDPTFADVPTTSVFYTQIEWMASEGISTGTPQPSGKPLYNPASAVSRAAMAIFLARYDGTPDLSVAPTVQSFVDVPVNSAPAAAIAWMAEAGISTGTPQPSGLPLYKPSDPVSRQAMAAFLYRLVHYEAL